MAAELFIYKFIFCFNGQWEVKVKHHVYRGFIYLFQLTVTAQDVVVYTRYNVA